MSKLLQTLLDGVIEMKSALINHEQWLYMGAQDIKLRYRRSILGPWWVTISTGFMIAMLGFLWSHIFGSEIQSYLPFFGVGFVVWGWMAGQISDAAAGFLQFQGLIKQIKLPFLVFILRLNVRQSIVLMHNSLIVVLVLLLIGKGFFWVSFMALPNLILVQINLTLLSVIVSIFCTRFQDMSQVVAVLTQIIFFFTPILWQVETLKNRAYLADMNPFYHWIEMIRAPLLGYFPTLSDYLWSFGSIVILFIIASYYLGRYRTRIAFWL